MYQQQHDVELQRMTITKDDLCDLFTLNKIIDGQSMQKVKQYGGDAKLAQTLNSQIQKGIESAANVILQRQNYGENITVEKEPTSLYDLIMECFQDTMLQILLLAALVSTIIGMVNDGVATGWTEGATIFLAVFLIVSITAGNNYIKEKQFRTLQQKLDESNVQVVRGTVTEISVNDVVVGDVLLFNLGDVFPVDGIMIAGSQVRVDESAMTGESDEIKKQPYNELQTQVIAQTENIRGQLSPFLLSGTKCVDGTGYMLVLAVGECTVQGKLKLLLDVENPPTPLQQKLEGVADEIGKLGFIVATLTFIALMGHLGYDCYIGKFPFLSLKTVQVIVEAFMIAVTIIVVAVPEGLPLAVTIALAYSVGKMKDQQNLVKNLSSCEIMGGANNICSDKTGTLTQNKMKVVQLWTENQFLKDPLIQEQQKLKKTTIELLAEGVGYNSNAFPYRDPTTNQMVQTGNKTECALIEMVDEFGFPLTRFRPSDKILRSIPFSSKRKKMSTAIHNEKTQFIRVYTKGASEIVLQQCTKYVANNGVEQFLDQNQKSKIYKEVIERFAGQALRTIALAYKDLDPQSHNSQMRNTLGTLKAQADMIAEDDLDKDLVLIGIAGIQDPIRPDVPKAIEQCHRSGVMVRMVTGDNILTASAIARELGIIGTQTTSQYEVMEGKTFRELVGGLRTVKDADGNEKKVVGNPETFNKISTQLRVMARASPEDKYVLVTGLIEEGNVIAVTGDGTNDAPALKKADVGFAMGITGSAVAKDAADIILMDDNFSSIVTAMLWGRNIYDCIRKFIQFQLTVNLVALCMSFLGAVIIKESPLNSIQMLWVNLIMDTFASLSLATEPPSQKVLERKPYLRNDPIISPTMYRTITGASLYQLIVLVFMLFYLPAYYDVTPPPEILADKAFKPNVLQLSIFFQTFVLMQVFNSITCRQLDYHTINPFANFCNNPLFWIVQGFTVVVQVLLITFGGKFVKVMSLTGEQHAICFGVAAFTLVWSMLVKFLPERIWSTVSLFREEEVQQDKMDDTLTSKLRRKSTMRLHTSQKRSIEGGSLMKLQSQKS